MHGSRSSRKFRTDLIPLTGPSAEKGAGPPAGIAQHFTKTHSLVLPSSPAYLSRKLPCPRLAQSWPFLRNKNWFGSDLA